MSPSTAHVYLVVVSLLHHQAGLSSTTRHNPRLQLALWEMARYHLQHTTRTRKQLTYSRHTLQQCCLWGHHNLAMFRAALSGILWLSSWRFTILSYQAFNPRIHATMADIQVNNNSPAFNNKHSKTDQLGKSHTIIL